MLIVAEKYRIATHIAKSLGFGSFNGDHFSNNRGDVICFSRGHLFQCAHKRDDEYTWDNPHAFNVLPNAIHSVMASFSCRIRDEEIPSHQLAETIIKFMQEHDEIVNACDMDREGERVFYDLFNAANTTASIYRMDLSQGLSRRLITEAFANLSDASHYKPAFYASQARCFSDFAYSLATQVLTYYARKGTLHPLLGGTTDARESVVSIGSVQAPLLMMIAEHCKEVEKHKIRSIHLPQFACKIGRYKCLFQYDPEQSETNEELLYQPRLTEAYIKVRSRLPRAVKVLSVDYQSRISAPPPLLNSSGIQKAMSDMSPDKTMQVLQSLYLKGLVSYPRSDASELPAEKYSNGRLAGLLERLGQAEGLAEKLSSDGVGKMVLALERGGRPNCVADHLSSAHSAIVPVDTPADFSRLTDDEQAVYSTVCERFADSMGGEREVVDVSISVKFVEEANGVLGEPASIFRLTRTVGTNAGSLLSVEAGQCFEATDMKSVNVPRDVPQYYPLAEIPELMRTVGERSPDPKVRELLAQSNGLGTAGTRAGILMTLIVRGYVEVIRQYGVDRVVITSRGQALLSILPRLYTCFELKALWERQLDEISQCADLVKAQELRNKFVRRTFNEIEHLCQLLNDGTISAYRRSKEYSSVSIQNQVRARAQQLGIEVKQHVLSNKQACIDFLAANPAPHTSASLAELEASGIETSAATMRDPRSIQIRNAQRHSDRPPSQRNLTKAIKLAALVHVKLPDKVKSSAKECASFIRTCESKRSPSVRMLKTVRSLAKRANYPLDASMLRKRSDVKALIRELRKKVRQ